MNDSTFDKVANTVIIGISKKWKLDVIVSGIIFVIVLSFSVAHYLGKEDDFGLHLDKDVYVVGEKAIMTVWNDSPYTITYDYNYRFQKEIDGKYENITYRELENSTNNSTSTGVEAVVHTGEERTEVIDISKLGIGNYVFIQEIKQHRPQEAPSPVIHTFVEEFEIKQN